MALPSNARIVELDFLQVKENFKNFLKSQSQFNDYNFDGAGLSILLDVLTYNTSYLAFYLNQVASEMFLDSAQLRSSVVSRAKHLGYTPRSVRSARAFVDITIDPTLGPLSPNPASILIPTTQEFSTIVDAKTYYFTPIRSVLINPVSGVYKASNVELIEGKRLSFRWTVDSTSSLKQRFIIPNANIDTSVLVVKVQESATNPSTKIFTLNDDITEITSESQVYFLQETDGGKYEIYFGDGTVGQKLNDGNIVIVEYIVSSGEAVLGAKSFAAVNKVAGYNSYSIKTVSVAADFYEQEDIDSIKLLAPLNYEAQNRAVTKGDYETLIKKDIPSIQYVRVWGGEDNDPPEYGRVFVSLKPFTGLSLSEDQKQNLINTYIRPRNIISLEVQIIEPDYLFLQVESVVLFRSRNTTLTDVDIQTAVKNAILSFSARELNGFDADFRYSKLVEAIDDADSSIQGNLTSIKLKYRIFPPFNRPTKYDIKTNNALSKGDATNGISSINSTGFIFRGIQTFISDDGKGSLYLYRLVNDQKVVVQAGIGQVDYDTGRIILNALEVQSIPNGQDFIDFILTPAKNDVTALREQILLLEEDDIGIAVEDLSKRV